MKRILYYIINILIILTIVYVVGVIAVMGLLLLDGNMGVVSYAKYFAPIVILIPLLAFRQKFDHELNYDEYGMNKKTGKWKRKLSPVEQRKIDLQQIYDTERILGKDTLQKMTHTGAKNPVQAMEDMTGLENVKEKIETMVARMEFDRKNKSQNNISSKHMCFYGNPGTGKTTVARIMTGFLYKYHYIQENKIIEVDGNFLKASNPTDTAMKTQLIIRAAEGGVLFIDEAYALIEDGTGCGTEAIATLIKQMEDKRDKFVLIIAGYTEPMKYLLRINPGFESRIRDYFTFLDYSDNELLDIFINMAEDNGFQVEERAAKAFLIRIIKERKQSSFGNARTVRNLLDEFIDTHALNFRRGIIDMKKCICYEDIVQDTKSNTERYARTSEGGMKFAQSKDELLSELDSLIGLQSVKEQVRKIEKYVEYTQALRKDNREFPPPNHHMIFSGNPGVGKTTTARIIGHLFYSIGLLPKDTFIECSRQDLVGTAEGQTAEKTSALIDRARGGVLFIDEAYSLYMGQGDSFGEEAIATLIKAMEDMRDELVVIFAGYTDNMKEFLGVNPGIRSRIGYSIIFPDYNAEELAAIYADKIRKYGLSLTQDVYTKVVGIMDSARKLPDFGNGRYADHLAQETVTRMAERGDTDRQVRTDDILIV